MVRLREAIDAMKSVRLRLREVIDRVAEVIDRVAEVIDRVAKVIDVVAEVIDKVDRPSGGWLLLTIGSIWASVRVRRLESGLLNMEVREIYARPLVGEVIWQVK